MSASWQILGSDAPIRRHSEPNSFRGSQLKGDASAQLNNPHIRVKTRRTRAYPGKSVGQASPAISNIRVRIAIVHVIEGIVGISPELKLQPFGERELLSDAEIHIGEARTDEGIT